MISDTKTKEYDLQSEGEPGLGEPDVRPTQGSVETSEESEESQESEEQSEEDDNIVDEDLPDDELLLKLNPIKLIKNTSLYVVSINGKPSFYVKDEKTANNKVWETVKIMSSTYIINGYHTRIIDIGNNQLNIIGRYNFILFACEKTLDTVSYAKVYESC